MTRAGRSRRFGGLRLFGIVVTAALAAACAGPCIAGCAVGTQDFTRPAGDPITPGDDDDSVDASYGGNDAADAGHITKTDASGAHDTGGANLDTGTGKDTSIPDTSLPDTNVPDTNLPDTNLPDTNVPDTNGNGSTCDGLTEWFAGITDQKVKHHNEEYTCKVAGWCSESTSNAVAAYEPGVGWAWTDAWDDSGACPP